MPSVRPLIVLFCFCLALAGFWYAPHLLGLDERGLMLRAVVVQIGGPIAAAACCYLAAWRSTGSDRAAWTSFAIGSLLYVVGNLCYLIFAVLNIDAAFPSVAEATYFLMALCFAAGMFQYGKVRDRVSRVQIYNFVLIYCAVTLASLFMLNQNISASVMGPFATIVAFVYPALWFSVAASGLISLLVYDQGRKALPFALLLLAVLAEASADFAYALMRMNGSFEVGGITQLLWVASAALIAWAAIEHVLLARDPVAKPMAEPRRGDRKTTQAAIPAVAIIIVLLSGSISGALGSGAFVGFSAALALAFAVIVGLREDRIIHTQRVLRSAVELSRADLDKTQEQLRSVLESTSDSVLVLDRDWNVTYFNQEAVKTINLADRLQIGISIWELFPAALTSGEGEHYHRAIATGRPEEFEIFVEDRKVWLDIHAYPSKDGLSIFFRDISERKRAHDEIVTLAHHDSLTGLANRVMFQTRLKRAVDSGTNVAMLLLDLDHFKEVNDTLGHAVGDELLTVAAKRLQSCVRPSDTIARLGGDEFAVIAANCSGRAEIALLARRIIEVTAEPHIVEGQSIQVGASLGIAFAQAGDGVSPDRIFRNADIALYAAKADARGGFRFFEPEMEVGLQRRQRLRAELGAALENDEFELAYQPVVDLHSEQVCGFEALLRWPHPTDGMVPPDVFIPLAEETGLIVELGEWVLRTACAEAVTWPAGISVAVNLSTRQFRSGDLADKVEVALTDSGLDRARLELEITESVLLEDSKANMLILRRFRDMGIRIALDDFGTGYSSLGYLQRFPFSKIKIDRSFISGLPANDESQAIVRSVIGLGQALGMRVTAEGVETSAQYDWVKAGCDEAQGYFLSRPVPAADIPQLLKRLGTTRRSARLAKAG